MSKQALHLRIDDLSQDGEHLFMITGKLIRI